MFYAAAVLLLLTTISGLSADPFIYNVYSSSGSQSRYGNPYVRDEVYIRRPEMIASPYYSGVGNQIMAMGGLQGLQGIHGMQGMNGMQSINNMQQFPYGLSGSVMNTDAYSSMYKPRFAASDMMSSGQPLVLNGYPMYPKTSGYPMLIPLGMGSFGSSPTFYQGPTVSRLPFRAAQRVSRSARYYY